MHAEPDNLRRIGSVPVAAAVFADHLQHRSPRHQFPSRPRFVFAVKKQGGRTSSAYQARECRIAFRALLLKCGQRRNLANKPPRLAKALRKLRMPRGQRLPDNVVESVHKVVVLTSLSSIRLE